MDQIERTAWLAERRKGIGGSDAASVMDVSPWKSKYTLFLEKTGLADEEGDEPEFMEWGRRLEPLVAAKFAEITGRKVVPGAGVVVHPSIPCMLGTLDYEQIDESRGRGVLECKTLNLFKADEWEEEPPLHYQVQIQHYMAVTGAKWASFAALIGGQRFVWCEVVRNDGFIEALESECVDFWRRVETGDAPPLDGSESTERALKRLYPRDSGRLVELPAEAVLLHNQIETCKAELKRFTEIKRTAENQLKAQIGDASEAFVPGGPRWSYRLQPRAGYSVEPTEFRVLRIKKGKEK